MSYVFASAMPHLTIGLDLDDKRSQLYCLPARAERGTDAVIPTTSAGLTRYFGGQPRYRVVLEVGTHSPWVARALSATGHEVLVANPSAMYGCRRTPGRAAAGAASFALQRHAA